MATETTNEKPASMPLVKLVNFLGAKRGQACYDEVLATLAVDELHNPDDNARFADVLIAQGGVMATIGRAIKIQAILHGATTER